MGRAVGGTAEKARILAAAQGVDDMDGHALAGFIEAEGSFVIAPNNRGRSWLCAMALNQRADDADMLLDIVRVTGLGRLHAVPARRSSRPQVVWSVTQQARVPRARRIAAALPDARSQAPRGAVWAAAVDRWSESLHGSTAAVHRLLASSAAELRLLRRYVDHGPSALPPEHALRAVALGLSGFLGGFFTGEGSFSLRGRAMATVHLRADDADLLCTFRDAFALGRVSVSSAPGANPSVRWSVCRRAELPRAIAMFDAVMLRGRKRREFEAWRIGAEQYARGRDRDDDVIAAASEALARARAYEDRPLDLPTHASPTEAYVGVLRAFAEEVPDGRLTCTAYARARGGHPEWPTRNTLTTAFGSWERALAAAGLGSRASPWRRARKLG